jgi:hypothetical protein
MTTLVPQLDASEALLRELRDDPRFTDHETPAPQYMHRLRATTETIIRTAAIEADEQP